MGITLYLSPMIEEDLGGGETAHYPHTATYSRLPTEGRVTMRCNRKWCLVAVDSDHEDPAMATDPLIYKINWQSDVIPSAAWRANVYNKLGITVPEGLTIKQILLKVLKRARPRFDKAQLLQWMADGKDVWIDLVNAEMDI